MRLKTIELDDEGRAPTSVTVVITHDEALFLAMALGRMTGAGSDELMTGGAVLSQELYACLTGDLFNVFYEDGVRSALSGRK